jgi:hypothetical protein
MLEAQSRSWKNAPTTSHRSLNAQQRIKRSSIRFLHCLHSSARFIPHHARTHARTLRLAQKAEAVEGPLGLNYSKDLQELKLAQVRSYVPKLVRIQF